MLYNINIHNISTSSLPTEDAGKLLMTSSVPIRPPFPKKKCWPIFFSVGTGLQNRCGPVRSRPSAQKPLSGPVSQLLGSQNPWPFRSHNCSAPKTPVRSGLTIAEPETGTGDRDRRPGPAPVASPV